MKTGRNRRVYIPFAFLIVLWVSLLHFPILSYSAEIAVEMNIAPAALNIQSNCVVVTVHTDIPCNNVAFSSVYIEGFAVKSRKANDCGYYVAKISIDEIGKLKGIIIGDYNTLTLLGVTTDGNAFLGTDAIKVIDISLYGK